MANIGTMLTGAELLAGSGSALHGNYGDHATWLRRDPDRVHLLNVGVVIATASTDAAYVYLERLSPILVPYVNAFIAHANQRVEKYWRTKTYRLVPIERSAPMNGTGLGPLQLLAASQPTDAEQLRNLAQLLMRAADSLEIDEANRLTIEREKLRQSGL